MTRSLAPKQAQKILGKAGFLRLLFIGGILHYQAQQRFPFRLRHASVSSRVQCALLRLEQRTHSRAVGQSAPHCRASAARIRVVQQRQNAGLWHKSAAI